MFIPQTRSPVIAPVETFFAIAKLGTGTRRAGTAPFAERFPARPAAAAFPPAVTVFGRFAGEFS
jgi:hypothetical protein